MATITEWTKLRNDTMRFYADLQELLEELAEKHDLRVFMQIQTSRKGRDLELINNGYEKGHHNFKEIIKGETDAGF